jgi:hypothetical protein
VTTLLVFCILADTLGRICAQNFAHISKIDDCLYDTQQIIHLSHSQLNQNTTKYRFEGHMGYTRRCQEQSRYMVDIRNRCPWCRHLWYRILVPFENRPSILNIEHRTFPHTQTLIDLPAGVVEQFSPLK